MKNPINHPWSKYLLRTLIAIGIWVFFKIATAPDLVEMTTLEKDSVVYLISTLAIVFILFELTDAIFRYWQKQSAGRFTDPVNLMKFSVSGFVLANAVLLPFNWFLEYHVEDWFGCVDYADEQAELVQASIFSAFFVIAFLIGYIVQYLYGHQRQLELVQEKLNKENITFQYESLKNQLNPHFLFNSFSVLTSLVHADPDLASDFVTKLSKIYRYVLENKQKELIGLDKEIAFLKSYIFLLKIRHDDSIQIHYDVDVPMEQFAIPTLALQLLAENAVKHNSFSTEEPLQIQVFNQDQEYLVVTNNKTIKRNHTTPSTGIGLENITHRYSLLEAPLPVIESTDEAFTVKLPLLQPQAA
jgi:hypothetical protein